jgi:mRNA interferase MazF
MYESGDIVLVTMQFTDTFAVKTRPALVLYNELGNIIVAGITSNRSMQGISLAAEDGLVKESVIKMNYIFTVSTNLVKKKLGVLSQKKRVLVHNELTLRLQALVM